MICLETKIQLCAIKINRDNLVTCLIKYPAPFWGFFILYCTTYVFFRVEN
nr:MAG TPA: hypothetical protein [Caudoviricetes sp.]